MARRFKLSRKASKKSFRRGAMRVKARNFAPSPMRGGIRL